MLILIDKNKEEEKIKQWIDWNLYLRDVLIKKKKSLTTIDIKNSKKMIMS